jgi:hypothetical protein
MPITPALVIRHPSAVFPKVEGMNGTDGIDFEKLIDNLKFTAATVDQSGAQPSGIGPHKSPNETAVNVEAAICLLTAARQLLQNIVGSLCPHCAGEMDRYADGRSATTHLRFCDGNEWVHIWHPVPEHQWNRPREVGTLTTRGGNRKQVVVSAPGHLDAYNADSEPIERH